MQDDVRKPDLTMRGHTRRITSIDFHPNAKDVVVTTSGDLTVKLWDIEKGKMRLSVDGHEDSIYGLCWNWDTSNFFTACRDKLIRVFDPRSNKITQKVESHEGAKGFKVTSLGNSDQLLSVGFSKSSERTIKLWDLRNFSKCINEVKMDSGAGFITPYYDPDTGVVFMCGKGDGNVKMFEINDESPYIHYLTEHQSNIPAQGVAMMPKTSCNIRECEIVQWFKLCSNYVEPLHFYVPRTRMEYFQDDLFPPTRNTSVPVLTADEWFEGKSKAPETISLSPPGMQPLSQAPVEVAAKKYDFRAEVAKKDNEFTKDKFLSSYYTNMTGQHGESNATVLKQDLMEGATAEEWDD